jgi:hypothetical protein
VFGFGFPRTVFRVSFAEEGLIVATGMNPADRLLDIRRDILRLQRILLRVTTAVDALADEGELDTEPVTSQGRFNREFTVFQQRIAARQLLLSAIRSGALLPRDEAGLQSIEAGFQSTEADDDDIPSDGDELLPDIDVIFPGIDPAPELAAVTSGSPTVQLPADLAATARSVTARRTRSATARRPTAVSEAHQIARNQALAWNLQRRRLQRELSTARRIAERRREEEEDR